MAKTIVVTGATRGLGRAMVEGFIERGHTVLGCGRGRAAIQKLQKQFGEDGHAFTVVDVSDAKDVQQWAKQQMKTYGAPDILINNAGVMNELAPLWDISTKDFDNLIDVNIKGIANTIRYFVPEMIKKGRGVIVNFSSYWGRSVDSEVAPYCASKWAVEGLTKSLAMELPRGLVAVPLNPGIIDTEILRTCFGSSANGYPLPDEWAESAVPYILKLGGKDNGKSVTVE